MEYTYQSSWSKDGSVKHTKYSAVHWNEYAALAEADKTAKSITLLRADKAGINAGKHFLHRIIK